MVRSQYLLPCVDYPDQQSVGLLVLPLPFQDDCQRVRRHQKILVAWVEHAIRRRQRLASERLRTGQIPFRPA
jgi:hypothetical protein